MRRTMILGLVLTSALVGCQGDDEGPTDTGGFGTVMGVVRDPVVDDPVEGVSVTVGNRSAISHDGGRFEITQVPSGDQAIVAAKDGYVSFEGTISVSSGETTSLVIALSPPAVQPSLVPVVRAATHAGDGSIGVFWEPAPGATSYRVYWSTSPGVTPGSGTLLGEVTSTATTHTGLTPNTLYYYVVVGISRAGEGPPSGEVVASSSDAISLSVSHPSTALAPGVAPVVAGINSTFQLTSVVARSGESSASLTFDSEEEDWRGDLSLEAAGVPTQITVTATDIAGASATASVNLIPLPRITLTVIEPDNAVVSKGSVRLRASCENCTAITVSARVPYGLGPMTVATGSSPLDQTASLAAFDGHEATLAFSASAGRQRVTIERQVYVEGSPRLDLSTSLGGNAQILDVSPDRVLAFDSTSGTISLKSHDRQTGLDQVLFSEPGARPTSGFLSPGGAIFVDDRHPGALYESRNGTMTSLGSIDSRNSLRVAGAFAIWSSRTVLTRRDLATGTNVVVATDAGNINNDVAANGDVVYWTSSYDIVRVRDGVPVNITSDGATTTEVYPVTDGSVIVYRLGGTEPGVAAFIDGGAIQLASGLELSYLVNNGWIAFTRPVPGGIQQVFLRSPEGEERQMSLLSVGAALEALAPNGALMLKTGPGWSRRLLVLAGDEADEAIDIGSSRIGRGLFVGSDAYVAIAGALFRVM